MNGGQEQTNTPCYRAESEKQLSIRMIIVIRMLVFMFNISNLPEVACLSESFADGISAVDSRISGASGGYHDETE